MGFKEIAGTRSTPNTRAAVWPPHGTAGVCTQSFTGLTVRRGPPGQTVAMAEKIFTEY